MIRKSDPYFFITYPNPGQFPGLEVRQHLDDVFSRLCEHLMNMTSFPKGQKDPPGYIDKISIPSGHDWWKNILSKLARCRILLPLYSERYFTSTTCGKEWHAFSIRQRLHEKATGGTPHAILPILWTPMAPEDMPRVAQEIQSHTLGMPALYHSEGLYGLAVNRAYRDEYELALWGIAKTIVNKARSTQLRACDPEIFQDLENIFDEEDPK
ncbi:TIR-like protein FxsC [Acrocarpospora phusangensis]|uniref:TIR-like protein FxsC n=1 Tax=Acrocarpospora phusangensis TaxID=1070424 RepID=UPI001950B322|nr:TIR-like protein FxsC [Acrocarpospora phusangensis]